MKIDYALLLLKPSGFTSDIWHVGHLSNSYTI